MRLTIAAVGRLKDGPERALYERYAGRIDAAGRGSAVGPLRLVEITEGRAGSAAARIADEAGRLLARLDQASHRIALDRAGRSLSSDAFANLVRDARDRGTSDLAFLIGGPDGHGDRVLAECRMKLSLGAMTLPHGLARVVLVEQLYRAITIIAGHPYHRG
jgi:23S rRNA (pseudouridine1915-N3)-methyltransferase